MLKIDEVLVYLLDGTWHDLSEIADALQLNDQKLGRIVKLLKEFSFIQINELKVRIASDAKKFLESVSKDMETGRRRHEISSTVSL